jgi:hypothetical protein
LPPGLPGGGITGIAPCPLDGKGALMPGSTDGGCSVPCCFDSRSLSVSPLWALFVPGVVSCGAICSGGGWDALGGASGDARESRASQHSYKKPGSSGHDPSWVGYEGQCDNNAREGAMFRSLTKMRE